MLSPILMKGVWTFADCCCGVGRGGSGKVLAAPTDLGSSDTRPQARAVRRQTPDSTAHRTKLCSRPLLSDNRLSRPPVLPRFLECSFPATGSWECSALWSNFQNRQAFSSSPDDVWARESGVCHPSDSRAHLRVPLGCEKRLVINLLTRDC